MSSGDGGVNGCVTMVNGGLHGELWSLCWLVIIMLLVVIMVLLAIVVVVFGVVVVVKWW